MGNNVSVERFRRLTAELKAEVRREAIAELNRQAEDLARIIESVAPRHEGVLKTTVRVVPGKKETQVMVIAGGARTLRQGVTSPAYDYARADEFGTTHMPAKPFFFPTYRLRKKRMRAAIKRKITAAIKKRSAT
jgi:HK97 gp10 family phage protein